MFYLSGGEHKKLLHGILPESRRLGVAESLRGWSWGEPPIYPDVSCRMPMYGVCSRYCPTCRDVYLNFVEKKRAEPSHRVKVGGAVHEVVRRCLTGFLEGKISSFVEVYNSQVSLRRIRYFSESMMRTCSVVWEYLSLICESKYESVKSEKPHASERDIRSTAFPFLIEHLLPGEFLGLSDFVRLDCFDYLRNIVFDLKVNADRHEWYRLYPTGYAMVLESIYEIPIDVGCVVFLDIIGEEVKIQKDLFFIGEELRGWWIEERDKKLDLMACGRDPGIAELCPVDCLYRHICTPRR
jgi:CRISPR-associated protein Csa1